MDADFSHDPAVAADLLARSLDGAADLVIGSRYVKGGGVVDWGIGRQVISRGGSLFARIVLALPVHDLTGGFKAWRGTTLASIPFAGVHAGGYVFQIEMTWRAKLAEPGSARCRSSSRTAASAAPRCRGGSSWRRWWSSSACGWSRSGRPSAAPSVAEAAGDRRSR